MISRIGADSPLEHLGDDEGGLWMGLWQGEQRIGFEEEKKWV